MRGKQSYLSDSCLYIRITPAGAGKTQELHGVFDRVPDHPRRCGENSTVCADMLVSSGSPPQVRGKPLIQLAENPGAGITPAGAGKTPVADARAICAWDHPRRCGENMFVRSRPQGELGSPPQVRGKLYAADGVPLKYRITPAGAGKTSRQDPSCSPPEDHPRRCGENLAEKKSLFSCLGSPPQVRGKPV